MELREQIAREVQGGSTGFDLKGDFPLARWHWEAADRILALPRIKKALELETAPK